MAQKDEEPCLTCSFRVDDQAGDGIHQAKDKVSYCQPSNVDHSAAEGGFDDSISHAHDEQQKERKRVSGRIQHTNNNQ